ncbi:MAG: SurA N-terminal domain-containing protein, partial [Solirubrobacterales bacterium]|nr:SurA N-terminal domain-containing protein [Solirubrobacterales bacterium]
MPALLPALAAALVLVVAPPALGESATGAGTIPEDAVVRVGDASIKKTTYKRWMRIAITGSRNASRRASYASQRRKVLQFLIVNTWYAQELAELGVVLSAAELERAFQRAARESFDSQAEMRRFLEREGMTMSDARFQLAGLSRYDKLHELAR